MYWVGVNFKMTKSEAQIVEYCRQLSDQQDGIRRFIAPPFPYLSRAAAVLRGTDVVLTAQNLHWADHGAYTGEVSAEMLSDVGVRSVLIGHSERRTLMGETDHDIGRKVVVALRQRVIPIICVGENREQRRSDQTHAVLQNQLMQALSPAKEQQLLAASIDIVIAYEPVWAIGSDGVPATPQQANEAMDQIRQIAEDLGVSPLTVIYGGSASPDNCRALIAQPHIQGLLLGRAGWNVEGFDDIVRQCLHVDR